MITMSSSGHTVILKQHRCDKCSFFIWHTLHVHQYHVGREHMFEQIKYPATVSGFPKPEVDGAHCREQENNGGKKMF